MQTENNEKPSLVETRDGFSVFYKERFLYSKYNPKKTNEELVSRTNILSGTLVLICSPILCYALLPLLEKLDENSFALLVEKDENLFALSKKNFDNLQNENATLFLRCAFAHPNELSSLPLTLSKKNPVLANGNALPKAGTFRRVVRLDFSAGVQFHKSFYDELTNALTNTIAQFWKNRITLSKLGKLFSKNVFRNLAFIPNAIPFQTFEKKITKPIVVLASGESIEKLIPSIKQFREHFFLLAVDASVPLLVSEKIIPDAIVTEESQLAIAKSFFSFPRETILFASLSSFAPRLIPQSQLCFFAPRFDDTFFFDKLVENEIIEKEFPPLGSVGISAIHLARLLRSSNDVPIFFAGNDFAFSLGKTHARGTLHSVSQLCKTNKCSPVENYGACFSHGAKKIECENGNAFFSSVSLLGYKEFFKQYFAEAANLYDAGFYEIDVGVKKISCARLEEIFALLQQSENNARSAPFCAECGRSSEWRVYENNIARKKIKSEKVLAFLESEKNALGELKAILATGKTRDGIAPDEKSRNEKISELLSAREYLYLHFPDGNDAKITHAFLTRVRSEIDFFLKTISTAKANLQNATEKPQ